VLGAAFITAGPAAAQEFESATVRIRAEVIEGLEHQSITAKTEAYFSSSDWNLSDLFRKAGQKNTIDNGRVVVSYEVMDTNGNLLASKNRSARHLRQAVMNRNSTLLSEATDAPVQSLNGRYVLNVNVCACAI
jgi:hypothetical protein